MIIINSPKRSIINFLVLLTIFSIPFYVLNAITLNYPKILPLNLGLGSFAIVCPITIAVILIYREDSRNGVKNLLFEIIKVSKIKNKLWYLPIFFIMPGILLVSYFLMRILDTNLPQLEVALLSVIVLFILYFISATFEETGWMGYLYKPMEAKLNAFQTSLVLGVIWSVWHVPFYLQNGHTLVWVFWECIFSIGARVVMTWLYKNNERSLLAVILFHAMIDVSDTLFPVNGSYYDPFYSAIFIIIIIIIILIFYSSKTLNDFRFKGNVQKLD